ncbi:MAG: hypothetical protein ACFFDF_00450 [Candidatus Odinarchaeota archaeon]
MGPFSKSFMKEIEEYSERAEKVRINEGLNKKLEDIKVLSEILDKMQNEDVRNTLEILLARQLELYFTGCYHIHKFQ